MRGRITYYLFFALVFLSVSASGQYYMPTREPATISRDYLKQKQFRVVYPWESDSLAVIAMRNALRYAPVSSLGVQREATFPIIMRNRTVLSNGSVVWSPSRMEVYSLTAGDGDEPVPWLQHLISHEIRHYQQMNALRQGTVWGASFLLGEQSVALASSLVPKWFFEGDAIYNESTVGLYGRANIATTYQAYRADLLSDSRLSYDEYLNRSYWWYAPNHYSFGSLMVEYGAHRFGSELWPYLMRYTGRYPFVVFPFHFGLKYKTGLSRHKLFEGAMRAVDSIYRAAYDPAIDPGPQERTRWASQRYPYRLPSGDRIVSYDTDHYHLPRLVARDEKSIASTTLFTPSVLSGRVSYSGNYAYFTQFVSSPIWRDIQSSDIWRVNLLTGEGDRLTFGGQYLSPCFDVADSTIVAIAIEPDGRNVLVKFDVDGLEAEEFVFFPSPVEMREIAVLPDGQGTLIRAVNSRGAYILRYSWSQRSLDTVLRPAMVDMSNLSTDGEAVYFTATYRYAKRAFRVPLQAQGVQQVELLEIPSYGITDLQVTQNGRVLFSDYTINGYRTHELDSVTSRLVDLPVGGSRLFPLPSDSARCVVDVPVDTTRRRYNPLAHAVRIHSWYPMYLLPTDDLANVEDAKLGLTVMSQNDLGTLNFAAGYFYSHGHGAGLQLTWKGLLPFIQIFGVLKHADTYRDVARYHFLKENIVSAGVRAYLPLAFSLRSMYFSLQPQVMLSGNSIPIVGSRQRYVSDGEMAFTYGARMSATRRLASLDLAPPYGIAVATSYRQYLRPVDLLSGVFNASATLYFPGLYKAHSTRVSGSYTVQNNGVFTKVMDFSNPDFNFDAPAILGKGIAQRTGKVEYSLPLAYPDWNIWSCLYIKRIYMSLWGRWQQVERLPNRWEDYRTIGLSLSQNFHAFRTQYPLRFTLRTAYSPWGDRIAQSEKSPFSVGVSFGVGLHPRDALLDHDYKF